MDDANEVLLALSFNYKQILRESLRVT